MLADALLLRREAATMPTLRCVVTALLLAVTPAFAQNVSWTCGGGNAGWMSASSDTHFCQGGTTPKPQYCVCQDNVLHAQAVSNSPTSGCEQYWGCLMMSQPLGLGLYYIVAAFPQALYPDAVGYFAAFGSAGSQAQFVLLGNEPQFRFQVVSGSVSKTWLCDYPPGTSPAANTMMTIYVTRSSVLWSIIDGKDNAWSGYAPYGFSDPSVTLQCVTRRAPANLCAHFVRTRSAHDWVLPLLLTAVGCAAHAGTTCAATRVETSQPTASGGTRLPPRGTIQHPSQAPSRICSALKLSPCAVNRGVCEFL